MDTCLFSQAHRPHTAHAPLGCGALSIPCIDSPQIDVECLHQEHGVPLPGIAFRKGSLSNAGRLVHLSPSRRVRHPDTYDLWSRRVVEFRQDGVGNDHTAIPRREDSNILQEDEGAERGMVSDNEHDRPSCWAVRRSCAKSSSV